MFTIDSITNKFRLSYLVFAILLCATFVSIFMYAETRMEQELVKARLLQQLELSQEKEGAQPIYSADSGITIYRFDAAPATLQSLATDTVQEMPVTLNNQGDISKTNLHFFVYQQEGQDYVLTYLEDKEIIMKNYPVLAIFEHLEDIFADALRIAVILSLLIAAIFSHLSSKQITKPLLDLEQAVEKSPQNLADY